MTNSFFQTLMKPNDIWTTAVTTPFGLYEWMVMPMGLRNSPSIHQRCVTAALWHLIGKICHVYIDDIIIWSKSVEDHTRDVRSVLESLRAASLFLNANRVVSIKLKLISSGIIYLPEALRPTAQKSIKFWIGQYRDQRPMSAHFWVWYDTLLCTCLTLRNWHVYWHR